VCGSDGAGPPPPLCFHAQKVLKHLLRAGLRLPANGARFIDPRVMRWLVEVNESPPDAVCALLTAKPGAHHPSGTGTDDAAAPATAHGRRRSAVWQLHADLAVCYAAAEAQVSVFIRRDNF
jgi:hypothetical protein